MGKRGNGEGSIYQDPSGKWRATISLDHGKRKYLRGATRKEVSAKLKRALHEQQQGTLVTDERRTVGEYLAMWVKECAAPRVRPRTLQYYEEIVRLHLAPALGKVALAKLSPPQVQALLNQKTESGLSPRRVQMIHSVLRNALNQALEWGLVARNVAKLTSPPRLPKYEVEPFTPEEARRFLDVIKGDRLEALYSTVLAIGLRQGEALGLKWEDLDLDARTLRVRRALQRIKGRGLVEVEPKSKQSRRTLRLPKLAINSLREHRVRQLEERLAAGPLWHETGYVFVTPIGTPLDGRNLTRIFQRHLERAGLRRQRFHDLRHCCASLLLAQRESARVVMELLGHSQISLTMNTYSHVMPTLLQEAADKIDALLTG